MVNASVGGFLKGFLDDRTKKMEREQERRDDLVSSVQKLQLEGIKKRQAEWDKQNQVWENVNAQAKSDPVAAYASYADAHGIKKRYESLGGKFKFTGGAKEARALLQQHHDKWKTMGRPEVSMAELEKLQLRRAADDDAIAGPIRDLFGLSSNVAGATPWSGVRTGEYDLSTPAGREMAAAEIVAKKDAEAAAAAPTTELSEEAPTEEPALKESDLWTPEPEKGVGAPKIKTRFEQITDPDTGSTDVWMINHADGQVINQRPIIQKKPTEVETNFTPVQKDVMSAQAVNSLNLYAESEGGSNDVAEFGRGDVGKNIIMARILEIKNTDTGRKMTDAAIADQATQEFIAASPVALSGTGWFEGEARWRNVLIGITPGGSQVKVPWHRVNAFIAAGGKIKGANN